MKTGKLLPRTRNRALIAGGLLLLLVLLLLGRTAGRAADAFGDGATTEQRVRFLADCGWEADPASEEEQLIHIPETFPPVFEDYNELQLRQGCDLRDYAGRDCQLYAYRILNGPDESLTVLANLYVFKGRIIGGDVHSTNLDGFMVTLR